MPKFNPPCQFIAGTSVVSMKVYEDEVSARLAVTCSLKTHLKKVLIDWVKQNKPEKQQESVQQSLAPQPVNGIDKNFLQTKLPEYFNDQAKQIVETCFTREVAQFESLNTSRRFFNNTLKRFNKGKRVWPDSFYERFVDDCIVELYAKGHDLLYQGSSTLVFYKEGQFVRALKPNLNSNGLNAKVNENIRIIGAENQFKKNGRFIYTVTHSLKNIFSSSKQLRAPRLIDIKENKIIWGDREGVLVVYEKKEGSSVGQNIYAALNELIQETKKINRNSISNVPVKINLGSAIYKLQEIVNKTPDLLSCHFYLIDEQEDTVINYTAKRNTCDPIDVALLASEEMTELLVETKVSTNYHLKRLIIGLFKNSLFNFLRALPLFIISGVIFIFSIFFPFSMLFAWGSLAFVAGLAMLAYYSCKAMNQLIKETKPTKEFGEVTLTKLESSHFSALFSKKLSNLSKHIFSNDKPSKQLSTDKTPSKNKKRLFCECKPKEEEQFELSFNVNHSSEPSDWDRSNSFRVSVENALFDKNKEHSSQQENQDRKIKEKLTLSAGINPFDEEGDLKPIIEQKIIAKITSSVVSPFDEGPNLKSIINTKQITQSSKNFFNEKSDKYNNSEIPKKNLAFNKEKKDKVLSFNWFKNKMNKKNHIPDLPAECSPVNAAVCQGG